MSESAPSAPLPSPRDQGIDPAAAMISLRERGAERFDPVRFRFIEALARRAGAYRGDARRILDGKLAEVLTEYGEHFEKARCEAGKILDRVSERFPDAADDLRQIYNTGDFRGLRRFAARLEGRNDRGSLADLVNHMAQHAPHDGANLESRVELKSLRYFRETWSKLSVDQQLAQALAQVPENAGPLNSHHLVLQSLKLMRAISPDYLSRFMSYVDALLWLDQANGINTIPMAKNVLRGESDKKRKPSRARSG